jgi:feruloyl esterase
MMKWGVAAAALMIAAGIGAGSASAQVSCEAMKGLQFPDVKITGATQSTSPVPNCKIDGVIGREIKFSVWLPDAWNGKFVMGGQGGFAGRLESQAQAMGALQKGYAMAGTDTGHSAPGAADGGWAAGDMERIINYAHVAIHRTTEVSKATVRARYGRPAEKSYFAGCSNGGREAMMSAQRYPDDFNGIVAGAPALNFMGITASFITITQKMFPDPKNLNTPTLDKPARDTLAKAVLEKCDALDGLKDGIMTDPRKCDFDVKTIACKGGKKDGCLTPPQIAAVDAIIKGPQLNGKQFAVGYPYGGEVNDAGWGTWLAGRKDGIGPGRPSLAYGFSTDFMRYFLKQDPNWNYPMFTPAAMASLPKDMEALQKTMSPLDPDLSAFRKQGGKLLMYHGWSDPALSPNMSTKYVDEVYAKDATAKNDVRLFMLPGVLHCQGGPGPDRVDALDIIDKWANGGAAPDEVTASFATGGGARKVCAYPKAAAYKGTGDGRAPDQFECK